MNRIRNRFGEDISLPTILKWLNQFSPEERPIIIKLLSNFRYYSTRRVNHLIRLLHQKVLRKLKLPVDRIWFVPVGYVAKSGSAIAYFYKKQNSVPQNRFISFDDLLIHKIPEKEAIVFLDDIISTGHQAKQVLQKFFSKVGTSPKSNEVIFATIVAVGDGMRFLQKGSDARIIAVDTIKTEDLPLSANSKVFRSERQRKLARAILLKYGKILFPHHPLGYSDAQLLLGFFYSTPNNTLPIFWSTEGGWQPLLPRGESFRDPQGLIGPPAGLHPRPIPTTPQRPIVEISQLDQYDISPDTAVKILTEFQSNIVLLVLAPIIHSLGMSDTSFAGLLKIIAKLKHFEHEKQPVCCALLIVPNTKAGMLSKDLYVRASADLSFSDLDEVLSLVQLVNGFSGALVATSHGTVLGNMLYKSADHLDVAISVRYRQLAAVSLDTDGVLFLFPGNGRSSVFHRGRRILCYRGASWHLQPTDLNRGIEVLASEHLVPIRTLQEALRIAQQMSDKELGGLITVGNHEKVLEISDKPKTSHFKWSPMKFGSADDDAIIGLVSQDGATIISSDGTVLQGMTFLRPPAGTSGEEEVGRGSKHNTSSKVSSVTKAICIAISTDGRITVYSQGRIAFKMMG